MIFKSCFVEGRVGLKAQLWNREVGGFGFLKHDPAAGCVSASGSLLWETTLEHWVARIKAFEQECDSRVELRFLWVLFLPFHLNKTKQKSPLSVSFSSVCKGHIKHSHHITRHK